MIHYHGTPIGGPRQDVARFLIGRHALIPFARPDDLGVALETCQSLIADNSAWSLRQLGREVDFDAYVAWVGTFAKHPAFDWCLIPDVIDGGAHRNGELVQLWLRCAPRFKGVPVWHLDEPLEYLEYLLSIAETIALGSSGQWATLKTPGWWKRMDEAMRVCCDAQGRPKRQIHGLRMLDPEIFRYLPLRSGDSTNAAVNNGALARFGMYPPATAAQRAAVIAERIEAETAAAVYAGLPQMALL